MSAHTPGPWGLGTSHGLTAVGIVGNNGKTYVGSVIDTSLSKRNDAAFGEVDPYPEGQANARLIVAAPELYALAQAVSDHFADTDAPLGEMARSVLKACEVTP